MVVRSLVAFAAFALLTGTAHADADRDGPIRGWRQVEASTVSATIGNEGIGTVRTASGTEVYYRGGGGIPQPLKDEGWGHVGDTDSVRGYVFDAYQWTKTAPATTKMFLATTPQGQSYEYVVQMGADETPVNSNAYVTASPDGQWLVAGPLGQVSELFVYPTPILNRATPKTGGELKPAARIKLDRPVRNLQGCDFTSYTRILCGTSDPYNDLFPTNFQLLQIDLQHVLQGKDISARVRSLGQVPLVSTCTGNFVTEGVDYDVRTRLLRVEVNPPSPCIVDTSVYTFRAS
jgi:hypothetical protein